MSRVSIVVRLPGHRVAAFCACWLVYDELHINTIAVDARLRRQGLATALMTHLLAEAAAQGARRTFLEVRRSNLPAQRLYERLGFTVSAIRRNYYSQPEEDALVLALDDAGGWRLNAASPLCYLAPMIVVSLSAEILPKRRRKCRQTSMS